MVGGTSWLQLVDGWLRSSIRPSHSCDGWMDGWRKGGNDETFSKDPVLGKEVRPNKKGTVFGGNVMND